VFHGQVFLRHQAAKTQWEASALAGFEVHDTGIGKASANLTEARALRSSGQDQTPQPFGHSGEFLFAYVLAGSMNSTPETGAVIPLKENDCLVLPRDMPCRLTANSDSLEFLKVRRPGAPQGIN
jgi:hypothetical protein